MALGDGHMGVDQAVQVGGETRYVGNLGVVGEVHGRRPLGFHAADGVVHRLGLELHRRGGREDAWPAVHVQRPIGQPEGVAGEEAAAPGVEVAHVMARMARGVEDADHPSGEVELEAIGGLDDALGRHRNQLAVELPGPLRPIHRRNASEQLGRLDHVPRATGVHHKLRVREGPHEGPRAAGVVEVDVGQQHEIHRLGRQPGRGEGLLHMHQRVVVAGIHQRGPAALLDQVDRCHVGAVVARLHRIDAVTESCQTLHCHPPSCICKGPILARLEVYRRPPASRL